MKVWVEGNGQRYKSDQKQLDQKTEFKTRDNGFSIAYKVNDKALLIGNLAHLDTNLDKNQATGKIKQLEAGLALRYAQSSHGWFDDISGKIGQINYRQNRYFNGASLASGKNKGLQLSGELRRGYRLTANNWQIEPSLGLQAVHLSMRQLKEQGELATDTTAFHKTDVNLSGGLQVKHLFQFNDWTVTPNLSLNYTHRLNGKNNEIQSDLFGVKIKSKSEIYSKNIAEAGFG
ncbi:MAG: autotransporter outer membrane beta-barrel domain-containing protein, partial [Mannheimia varigena]|nr:autotransporter outer membrane beta-barrel domain-containing protein [Mannheimia varigena]